MTSKKNIPKTSSKENNQKFISFYFDILRIERRYVIVYYLCENEQKKKKNKLTFFSSINLNDLTEKTKNVKFSSVNRKQSQDQIRLRINFLDHFFYSLKKNIRKRNK